MRIEKKHCSALVIDIQERLFPHIYQNEALAKKCVMLINGLNILHVPIMLTQQYTKGLGETIAPVREALGDVTPIEKLTFSACASPGVEMHIMGSHGHQVIVCGIEAHVCVQQTVLDIQQQGRTAIVVEDCISSRFKNDKKVALHRMRDAGAVITTAESLLFELLEEAGTETFKKISALVK